MNRSDRSTNAKHSPMITFRVMSKVAENIITSRIPGNKETDNLDIIIGEQLVREKGSPQNRKV